MDEPVGPALAPGSLLAAHYRVHRLLEADLGGRRYLAEDSQGPTGALVVHELFAPAIRRTSDRTEAAAWLDAVLSRLYPARHPALAPLVDGWADPAPGGSFYVVHRHVPGPPLTDELVDAGGAIPWRQALEWALILCDLLSYLHTMQPPYLLGHLRPEHLVLDSRTAAPVVVNLGLTAAIAGRPWDNGGYTPLEQYISRPAPRSDLYALGALLHTLLGGHNPDMALAARLRSGLDLQRCLRTLFPPLDEHALGLPPGLAAVVVRATSFNADDRFDDAASMAAALRALLGPPVQSASPTADTEELPVWQQLGVSREAWFDLAPAARNAALLQLMGRRAAPAAPADSSPTLPPAPAPLPSVQPTLRPVQTRLAVDAGGGVPYAAIAVALAAASSGTHIDIAPGVYSESLRLDRPAALHGPIAGEEAVVESRHRPCLTITAGDAVVQGLVLRLAEGRSALIDCAARALVEDCTLIGGAPAVLVHGEGVTLTLRRCTISESLDDALRAGPGAAVVLEDCTLSGAGGAGLHLQAGAVIDARRCAVRDGDGPGLVCESGAGGLVVGCDIVGNAGAGLVLADCPGLTIRACRIGYNGGPALSIGPHAAGAVEDCDLTGNAGGPWQFPDDDAALARLLRRDRNRE